MFSCHKIWYTWNEKIGGETLEKERIGLFQTKDKKIQEYPLNQQCIDLIIEELTRDEFLYVRYQETWGTELELENLLEKLFVKQFEGRELNKQLANLRKESINRKKKNWMKVLDSELEAKRASILDSLDIIETPSLENLSDEEQADFYIQKVREKAESWFKDKKQKLIDYPMFRSKSNVIQKNSILDDISYLMGNSLKQLQLSNPTKNLLVFPRDDIPFDEVSKKQKLHINELHPNKAIYTREDKKTDELTYNYNYSLALSNTVYPNVIETRNLDAIDRIIIGSAISHAGEDFVTKREFDVPLLSIVKDVFKSNSKKSYETVENRLLKIRDYSILKIEKLDDATENKTSYGYFDFVKTMTTQDTGERIAHIVVNKYIHEQYVDDQVFRIYKEQLDRLDFRTQNILFYLQKERILCNRQTGEKQVFSKLNYINFTSNVNFSLKRKSLIRKQIVESLKKLKEEKIVIQDYRIISADVFQILFIPLGDEEVQDFLSNVTLETTKRILPIASDMKMAVPIQNNVLQEPESPD